jgi:O-antigen ligase/polysaccharide polymerase Wzy-like membrane protein
MPTSIDRRVASRIDRASPARDTHPAISDGEQGRALIVLIIAVVAMPVLPYLVKYLNVKHEITDVDRLAPQLPLARVLSLAAAVALFLVCWVIVIRRSHLDRKISGATIILLGLIVPYVISPNLPETADIVKVALGAAVIIAVWSIGAPVDGLRWIPIAGSLIGIYSIIGGLIIPDYMMSATDQTKLIIPNWQLAGPFWHANVLGLFSVLSLALIPLIVNVRWRIFHGLILCATIVATAQRTALVAAGILALWWIICWFRPMISVRFTGTALIGCCAAAVVMLPLLNSNPHAFVGRGYAWATSLSLWQESPLVGLGIHFVGTKFRSNPDSWAFNHGHNLFVDALLRSGLVGLCLVVLILLAAVRSTRAFDVPSHQTAFFGYLIAFLVASATEVNWTLLPTRPLFPVVGFVFAVLICREPGRPSDTNLADMTMSNRPGSPDRTPVGTF